MACYQLLAMCLFVLAISSRTNADCAVEVAERVDCGYYGVTQSLCEDMDCCWMEDHSGQGVPWCYYSAEEEQEEQEEQGSEVAGTDDTECAVEAAEREDCGYYGITESECEDKGCCWMEDDSGQDVPWCYYSEEEEQEEQGSEVAGTDDTDNRKKMSNYLLKRLLQVLKEKRRI